MSTRELPKNLSFLGSVFFDVKGKGTIKMHTNIQKITVTLEFLFFLYDSAQHFVHAFQHKAEDFMGLRLPRIKT